MNGLILGQAKPMAHQLADVLSLERQPRVNLWNGLGTGKMFTGAWLVQRWWLAGMIDACIVVAPSMCAPDWMDAFTHMAWPDGLANVYDARPPDQTVISEFVTSGVRAPSGRMPVYITSYGGLRAIAGTRTQSRYVTNPADPLYAHLRGSKIAILFDESQAAALHTSQQSKACRAVSNACTAVISMTATPIGNPLSMRLFGMTSLVRPDILAVNGVGEFIDFKERYGVLVDPVQRQIEAAGGSARFVAARAYPVSVHQSMIEQEILKPMAPFSARRTKKECLDLPDKVYLRRSYRPTPEIRRLLTQLVDDDRAVLQDGYSVVVNNALEERLRTVELSSGWLADRVVHDLKIKLLSDVVDEIDDNLSAQAPFAVWCSRTRELLACALVCAGVPAEEAMKLGTEAASNDEIYKKCIVRARAARVGVIHGRTQVRDRDKIQADWKSGQVRVVVAHPGVAGAGLNWQHTEVMIYFSQPLGTISRQQSEDRMHRHGLKHAALYYDLVMENGPDQAIAIAHSNQANAATAMLNWLDTHARRLRI